MSSRNHSSLHGAPYSHAHHHRSGNGRSGRQPPERSRARVGLACARCRRRKIRCSGDPLDGSGCDTCKNVGAGTSCQFMRVQSHDISDYAGLEMLRTGSCIVMPGSNGMVEQYQRRSTGSQHQAMSLPQHHSRFTMTPQQTHSTVPESSEDSSFDNTSLIENPTAQTGRTSSEDISAGWTSIPPASMPADVTGGAEINVLPEYASTSQGQPPFNLATLETSLPPHSTQTRRRVTPRSNRTSQSSSSEEFAFPRSVMSSPNPHMMLYRAMNTASSPQDFNTSDGSPNAEHQAVMQVARALGSIAPPVTLGHPGLDVHAGTTGMQLPFHRLPQGSQSSTSLASSSSTGGSPGAHMPQYIVPNFSQAPDRSTSLYTISAGQDQYTTTLGHRDGQATAGAARGFPPPPAFQIPPGYGIVQNGNTMHIVRRRSSNEQQGRRQSSAASFSAPDA